MAGGNGSLRPDVSDIEAVHGAFRDTFAAASELVGTVQSEDAGRRALIANFYANICSFLHAHHQTEEDLVFPLLRARCPDRTAILERAAAQHEEVLDLVGRAEGSLTSWSNGEAGSQERCARDLTTLGETLAKHLDDEESEVIPLCAERLSIEEWGAQPGHGMALFQGDKIWLVLGLIRERMTQSQRDEMLAHMPPPAVEMWTGFGERAFGELMGEVGAPLAG
jgi:hypothetical protein